MTIFSNLPFRRKNHIEQQEANQRIELLQALDAAGRRQQEAQRYFDAVSDSDLVTLAVHELESSAAHYRALLRKARLAGLVRPYWEAQQMKSEACCGHPNQPEKE